MRLHRPLTALALVGLLAAQTAHAEKVLRRANQAEPESLDPQKTTGLYESRIESDLFEGLVMLNADQKPVPAGAESWDVTPDKKLWTFHLRHDAKWSNGEPVTAEDYVYSFRRLVDPKTAAAETDQLADVVNAEEIVAGQEKDLTKLGVKALDPYTLQLTLKRPQIILPLMLTDHNVRPLNRKAVEGGGEDWTRPNKIVTNGPFVMADWVPHSEILLKKNPGYYNAAAVKLDVVRWMVMDNTETGFKQFRAGEIDITSVPRQQIKWARENMQAELRTGDTLGSYWIQFDMAKGPLAKHPKVREALSLSVDRDLIVNKIVPLGEKPAYSLIPTTFSNYTNQAYAWKDQPLAERQARAKQLLAEEGYSPDHPLKIEITYTTDETVRTLISAIANMWKPLGIEVTLQNQEWQVYEQTLRQHNYTMGVIGSTITFDDVKDFINAQSKQGGMQNTIGYDNPAYEELFQKALDTTDFEVRQDLMEKAEKTFLADYPLIPLYYGTVNTLVNPKVEGWRNSNPDIHSMYLSLKD